MIVYAGVDPVTGRRSYLRETIQGTDKAARKRAEKALNRLLAQVDGQRSASSSTSMSHALDEGMRRRELVALRFSRLDLDNGVIDLRRNWVGGNETDTKTHQNRRIALDSETIVLLREHEQRVRERVESLGGEFTEDLFVFTGTESPDHSHPYPPDALSSRYMTWRSASASEPTSTPSATTRRPSC